MDDLPNCPVCNNPRKSDGSGSLTQWIVTCECDLAQLRESAQGLTTSVCALCGKRTREALPDSMSEFIVSSDRCSCPSEELERHARDSAHAAGETSFREVGGTSSSEVGGTSSNDVAGNVFNGVSGTTFNGGEHEVSGIDKDDDAISAAETAQISSSAVLSSFQKTILETGSESRSRDTQSVVKKSAAIAGLILISSLAILVSVKNLFHTTDSEPIVTKKIPPPDETLSDRMRLYVDQKWTKLAKRGTPFYDAGPENTDDDFALLNQFNDVRSIRNLRSESITGAGLAQANLPRLGSLDLASRELNDEGMKAVARFKTLELLTLVWFYKVSEAGMLNLEQLPKLKLLRFSHATLPRNTLRVASRIPSLEELDILVSEAVVTPDLIELSKLPQLRILRLCTVQITDADCIVISRLPHVRELDLLNNQITDVGVRHLSTMPLTILNLSGNKITDEALAVLSKSKTLKTLIVNECRKISPRGKALFRESAPGCELSEEKLIRDL